MDITAALVKELRERTGAGMMECKKALTETAGDLEAAVAWMRKHGLAQADKKAGRVAAEGLIRVAKSEDGARAALVEVNCETDFVAKSPDFVDFAQAVAGAVLARRPMNLQEVAALPLSGGTVDEVRRALIAKVGENVSVRRYAVQEGRGGYLASYLHGGRIGVLVNLQGGDEALAKDIAMHVAASRPAALAPGDVPREVVEKEKEIYRAQAQDSGKPADIVDKMVTGRVSKFLREVTLLGQPFVKNPDLTVEQLLKSHGATVAGFVRYEVGEGLEKRSEDFAAEVMAQVRGH